MESKICNKCGETKELSEFHYHSIYQIYIGRCKKCVNTGRNERYKKKIIDSGKIYNNSKSTSRTKICSNCNEEKSLTEYKKSRGNYSKFCDKCHLSPPARDLKDNFLIECRSCGEEKSAKENYSYGRAVKEFSKICNLCRKEISKSLKNCPEEDVRLYKRAVHLYSVYRRFDSNKELFFDLELPIIVGLLHEPCNYCGFPSTGLDRIDNSKGHTEDNCIPCCWECNTARMDNFTHEEMLKIGKTIREVKLERT